MSKLITLLEKLVFIVAGAVIVILAHISKSNAEPVDIGALQQESFMQLQVSTFENQSR